MSQMIRKQIYILKSQDLRLKRLAKARGISEAELIRQALDAALNGSKSRAFPLDQEAWEQALAFMKAIHARGPLKNQPRTWKREDAYEERLSRYDRHSR